MEDEEGGSANLAADVDTDSYEVLSTHPFCRALRKEVILAISRASKRWVLQPAAVSLCRRVQPLASKEFDFWRIFLWMSRVGSRAAV